MNINIFKNNFQSYLLILLAGVLAALGSVFLDHFPNDDLWYFSAYNAFYGFWLFSALSICFLSEKRVLGGFNAFLYLFVFCILFYFLKWAADPLGYSGGKYPLQITLVWCLAAAICGLLGALVYPGRNQNNLFSSISFSFPIAFLLVEVTASAVMLVKIHSGLFPLICDSLFVFGFFLIFSKREKFLKNILFVSGFLVILDLLALYLGWFNF